MRPPAFVSHLANFAKAQLRPALFVALLAGGVGILTDRFVGGVLASKAGQVQAFFLVAFFLLVIVTLLFNQYSPRVMTILEWWPVAALRLVVFVAVTVFGLLCLGFIAVGVFSSAG